MDLSTMLTNLRLRIDDSNSQYWTDAELTNYINDAYLFYWQWYIDAEHPGAIAETSLNIVAGTATISLPSDFCKARLVERVYSDYTIPLQYIERWDRANRTSGSSLFNQTPSYRIAGSNGIKLILEPTPQESVTSGIKLHYFFYPLRLEDSFDEPETAFNDFFHDIIIVKAAVLAKDKEESVAGGGSPTAGFSRYLEEREQKLKETIAQASLQRTYVEPFGLAGF